MARKSTDRITKLETIEAKKKSETKPQAEPEIREIKEETFFDLFRRRRRSTYRTTHYATEEAR